MKKELKELKKILIRYPIWFRFFNLKFINELSLAAIELGFDKDTALKMSIYTTIGTIKLIEKN